MADDEAKPIIIPLAVDPALLGGGKPPPTLTVTSWNIAAVNNNPFEYYLTHPDAAYEKLMADVERFIEAPGADDVAVSEVFTDAMFAELAETMDGLGWHGVDAVTSIWRTDLSRRTVVAGFLKDKELGAKRLMSMPDRMTNTIDLEGGGVANRPTLISNYDGDMSTRARWWESWTSFMFRTPLALPPKRGVPAASKPPCALLQQISRAKCVGAHVDLV
jgi:hypothetical protein